MEKNRISPDELNNLSKETVIMLYKQLNDSFNLVIAQSNVIQKQNEQLLKQVETMQEKLDVLTMQHFGRKTEKNSQIMGQLSLDLENFCVLNEAEILTENGMPQEPELEEVIIHRRPRKTKGKREDDLKGIETVIEPAITLPESYLEERFPKGYHRLPDEVYKDLEYIPAKFLAHEHHIAVYAGNHDVGGIVRANRPGRILSNSILTPALAAAIFNAKYLNAIPLNRLSEEFLRNDVRISRQVMASWMIKITERLLEPVYHEMHDYLMTTSLIHCDETPFKVINDGRGPDSKNYMWVYHSNERYGIKPVYIYEYQPTRNTNVPLKFLEGFNGILVTDGYQVYHTLENQRPDEIKVAGCWAHAKRKFADIIKATGKSKTLKSRIAEEASKRISAISHIDNMFKDASPEERLSNRNESVRPLVDAYFVWVKEKISLPSLDHGSLLYKALNYSVNQEIFLRRFLEDGIIPMNNNDAERSIRSFCVGKHSWHVIDSKKGAHSSGVLYSIAETAKANGLKPYEYFKYLLEELIKHNPEEDTAYLSSLVPWSDDLPDYCRKQK